MAPRIALPLLAWMLAAPGRAEEGPPSEQDAPEAAVPNCVRAAGEASPKLPEGPRATVSGIIQVPAGAEGKLLIEVMDEKLGGEKSLYSLECREAGPFEVELASAWGQVRMVGFLELQGNGPTADDLTALSQPIDLSSGDVEGVKLALAKGTDLGRFAPKPAEGPTPSPPPASEEGGGGAP